MSRKGLNFTVVTPCMLLAVLTLKVISCLKMWKKQRNYFKDRLTLAVVKL